MTKLEKLQKEYPMFKLVVRPATKFIKQCYAEEGCKEPERMLIFRYGTDSDYYSDYVGDFDWSIAILRKNLNRWVSKI